ncbi:MAG: energy transducer TonB [Gammaproteobacteria bacterium]|nr:energy transducer TonB [Gammaproteobacteria bacterium]
MHGEPQPISAFTVVSRQSPTFPRYAVARSDGGWVEVEFTVSRTGRVTDAEVRQASASLFVEPSLDAIRDWRFEPVLMDGRPVPARGVLRFTFRP